MKNALFILMVAQLGCIQAMDLTKADHSAKSTAEVAAAAMELMISSVKEVLKVKPAAGFAERLLNMFQENLRKTNKPTREVWVEMCQACPELKTLDISTSDEFFWIKASFEVAAREINVKQALDAYLADPSTTNAEKFEKLLIGNAKDPMARNVVIGYETRLRNDVASERQAIFDQLHPIFEKWISPTTPIKKNSLADSGKKFGWHVKRFAVGSAIAGSLFVTAFAFWWHTKKQQKHRTNASGCAITTCASSIKSELLFFSSSSMSDLMSAGISQSAGDLLIFIDKTYLMGMQCLAGDEGMGLPIDSVAEDRMADGSHMNSNLVRPSGNRFYG